MNLNQLVAVILFTSIISSCGGGGGGGGGGEIIIPTGKESATLTWNAPLKNEDDTDIIVGQPGEIKKYRVYLSTDKNNLNSFIEFDAATYPNSYTINYAANPITSNATIFVAMTAINDNGIESIFSSPIIEFKTK